MPELGVVGPVVPYVNLDAAITLYDNLDAAALRSELVARDAYIDNLQMQKHVLHKQLVNIRQSNRMKIKNSDERKRRLRLSKTS